MTDLPIAHRRLHNQRLTGEKFATPDAVVRWFGAVQAQDYAGAKWAVGQRMVGATDAALDRAFADGTILRTHVLRPTWHFVAPADIRWLLALTAPRVNAANAYHYRRLGLDDAAFARSNAVLAGALQGGNHLTRTELAAALRQADIATDDLRLTLLVMRAELDGVICSGARRGKQFTYALLNERVPPVPALTREEALATLTLRYFTSHGPATSRDFVWWSGSTMADARAGLAMVGGQLLHEERNGGTYWFAPCAPVLPVPSPTVFLLPNYDEYTVGYTDRRDMLDPPPADGAASRGAILLDRTIVVNGHVVGTWKRTVTKDAVIVDVAPSAPLGAPETVALHAAVDAYGKFLELPAMLRSEVDTQ